MLRSHTCGELRMSDAQKEVVLSGWVQRSRDLGGMTFIDLRDRYGITQLAFNMEANSKLCLEARKLGREYVIKVSGQVIAALHVDPARPQNAQNHALDEKEEKPQEEA